MADSERAIMSEGNLPSNPSVLELAQRAHLELCSSIVTDQVRRSRELLARAVQELSRADEPSSTSNSLLPCPVANRQLERLAKAEGSSDE